ncbi:hypothetical protein ABTA40_19930, partial [Acinetobacter baumannii]
NATAAALTQQVLSHLRALVEEHHGGVIKSLGDGLLAAFPACDDSIRAACAMIDIQDRYGLRLRVGIHHGSVIEGVGDL